MKNTEQVITTIVETKTPSKVNGVLIDTFTASMIKTVGDNLTENNRSKLYSMPVNKMVAISLKMLKISDNVITEDVADDAKRQGLEYMSFGRYGKDGKVTHRSVDGKLQPIGKSTGTPIKVSTNKPIGHRVADIGPGGKETNVQTDPAGEWDRQSLPSFDEFRNANLGAGRDVTKHDWHSYIDKNMTAKLEKKMPPTLLPAVASKSDTEEAAKEDFSKVLKQFKIKNGMVPRTSKGNVEPAFIVSMVKHVKKFPYSNQIWNVFGGAGGEQPAWMPTVFTTKKPSKPNPYVRTYESSTKKAQKSTNPYTRTYSSKYKTPLA
jgi:hypothetical protein